MRVHWAFQCVLLAQFSACIRVSLSILLTNVVFLKIVCRDMTYAFTFVVCIYGSTPRLHRHNPRTPRLYAQYIVLLFFRYRGVVQICDIHKSNTWLFGAFCSDMADMVCTFNFVGILDDQ